MNKMRNWQVLAAATLIWAVTVAAANIGLVKDSVTNVCSQAIKMTNLNNVFYGSAFYGDGSGLSSVTALPDDGKADKVAGATAGNLAALNASGNLYDAGAKIADYLTAAQIASGYYDNDEIDAMMANYLTANQIAEQFYNKDEIDGRLAGASNWDAAYADTSNATSDNTADTIVKRDASGNFSAGTITANLTGDVTGNCSGTAGSVAVANITGMGSGVGTWLATPSSANLASALTDETGSGKAVFATSPTMATQFYLDGGSSSTDRLFYSYDSASISNGSDYVQVFSWPKNTPFSANFEIHATAAGGNRFTLKGSLSGANFIRLTGGFEATASNATVFFPYARVASDTDSYYFELQRNSTYNLTISGGYLAGMNVTPIAFTAADGGETEEATYNIIENGMVRINQSPLTHFSQLSGSSQVSAWSASLANGEFARMYAVGRKSGGSYRYARLMSYYNSSSTSNEAVGCLQLNAGDGDNNYLWFDDGGLLRTSTNLANIGTTTGTVIGDQTSDIRLKKDVDSMPYGLREVLQLEPIMFKYKSDPDSAQHIGFSAQQVKGIIPEAVYNAGVAVEDESGEILKEKDEQTGELKPVCDKKMKQDGLAMRYADLIPVLVNAVKEQQAQIDDLKRRVEMLEGRNK